MSKEEPRKPFKALDGCVMAQEIVNEASSLEEAKKKLENLVYCVLQRDLELMSENPDDRINKYTFMDGLKVSLWVVKKTGNHKQALKDLERLYEIVEAHDWELLISSVESHYGFAVSNLS